MMGSMKPPEGSTEPVIAEWQRIPVRELPDRLGLPGREQGNRVILVDGRSAGGKTTLADRLRSVLPGSVVSSTPTMSPGTTRCSTGTPT